MHAMTNCYKQENVQGSSSNKCFVLENSVCQTRLDNESNVKVPQYKTTFGRNGYSY